MNQYPRIGSRRRRTACLLAAVLALSPSFLRAFVFEHGALSGSFDTTTAIGTLVRLDNADRTYYGTGNGGLQRSVNNDDGNLNYHRGLASLTAKVSNDLQLKYGSGGMFVRSLFLYDTVNADGKRAHTALSKGAMHQTGRVAELLDAYVYYKANLEGMPADFRFGKQVLSWGESTFIPNGINVINPIDVSKLRVPGSEIRDALRPLPMVSGSLTVAKGLTIDAFYLLDWERTRIDPPGTLFSTNDYAGPGGERIYLGFGAVGDKTAYGYVPRGADRTPGSNGQFGVAARWLASQLNNTEFGFFVVNHHSRLPVISAITPTSPITPFVVPKLIDLLIANGAATAATAPATAAALLSAPPGALPAPQAALVAGAQQLAFFASVATARYTIEFPKDIRLYGVSFNTDFGGIALQGEIAYRQSQPLQIDDVELLFAALSSVNPTFGPNNQVGNFLGQLGTYIAGFRRKSVWQAQMTATKVFGPMLGAQQFTLLGEVGGTRVPDLPDKSVLRYDGPATYLSGSPTFMTLTGNGALGATPLVAFADKLSWGYQVVGRLDYNNAFKGVNVSPLATFSHDVKGTTPLPLGNFIHGRKSFTLGADFTFQNKWAVEARWVNYFGAGPYNLLADRDFAALTVKYSF
jgi:hypothetical protein